MRSQATEHRPLVDTIGTSSLKVKPRKQLLLGACQRHKCSCFFLKWCVLVRRAILSPRLPARTHTSYRLLVCVCLCVCAWACKRACVCGRAGVRTWSHLQTFRHSVGLPSGLLCTLPSVLQECGSSWCRRGTCCGAGCATSRRRAPPPPRRTAATSLTSASTR